MTQSDRQSKNYDEATKVFLYHGKGGRRGKETYAKAHRISHSSQNLEATYASYGSCGISAPIAQRKQNASSCTNKTSLEGVSAPCDCRRQKRRRNQSEPTRIVGCWKSNLSIVLKHCYKFISVYCLFMKESCFAISFWLIYIFYWKVLFRKSGLSCNPCFCILCYIHGPTLFCEGNCSWFYSYSVFWKGRNHIVKLFPSFTEFVSISPKVVLRMPPYCLQHLIAGFSFFQVSVQGTTVEI